VKSFRTILEGIIYTVTVPGLLIGPGTALYYNNSPVGFILILVGILIAGFIVKFYRWDRQNLSRQAKRDLAALRKELKKPEPDCDLVFSLIAGSKYTVRIGGQTTCQK